MKFSIKFISVVLIISILMLTGCTSGKIDKLMKEAEQHLESKNYEEAINTYTEILELKEDEEVSTKLQEVKEIKEEAEYEILSVETVKKVHDDLYELLRDRLRSGISITPTEFEFILRDLQKIINEFERLDDSRNTDIARYIKRIKSDFNYEFNIKSPLSDNYFSEDAGLSEALGQLDDGFASANTMLLAMYRSSLIEGIEFILSQNLPEKYI